MPNLIRTGAVLLVAGLLGACSDYLDRRDTLALGAGDAVETNIATQVIDPWPRHARDVRADTNGERLQHAMERYRSPQSSAGGQRNGGSGFGSGSGGSSGSPPPTTPVTQ